MGKNFEDFLACFLGLENLLCFDSIWNLSFEICSSGKKSSSQSINGLSADKNELSLKVFKLDLFLLNVTKNKRREKLWDFLLISND